MTKATKPDKPEIKNMSYEQAFAELEEIVGQLEADSSSLEDALILFERGQLLSKHCGGLLEQADLRVRQLVKDDLSAEGD